MRGVDGSICRNIWHYGKLRTFTPINAPSLGPVVDSFLDAFGYDSALVDLLYENYVGSDNGEMFAGKVAQWVPFSEAIWYWDNIKMPYPPRMRVRNIPSLE